MNYQPAQLASNDGTEHSSISTQSVKQLSPRSVSRYSLCFRPFCPGWLITTYLLGGRERSIPSTIACNGGYLRVVDRNRHLCRESTECSWKADRGGIIILRVAATFFRKRTVPLPAVMGEKCVGRRESRAASRSQAGRKRPPRGEPQAAPNPRHRKAHERHPEMPSGNSQECERPRTV